MTHLIQSDKIIDENKLLLVESSYENEKYKRQNKKQKNNGNSDFLPSFHMISDMGLMWQLLEK